jgi:hypothetical protein
LYRKRASHNPVLIQSISTSVPPSASASQVRGLEFTSYAFATSREQNVKLGELFDTPAFEWLDAYEERSTVGDHGR